MPKLFVRRDLQKPIEAMQYTRETAQAVADWCGGKLKRGETSMEIVTIRVTLRVYYGDWIRRKGMGFTAECDADFRAVYEPVEGT